MYSDHQVISFFALKSPLPKETHCLAFYIHPNPQVENEADEVSSKNTEDYIFKNKTII